MSSPRRVRTIYSVIASPNRLDILRILNTKGPLSYSELKTLAGFKSKKESGKFAYHLRKLVKQTLISLNRAERKYIVTSLGRLVLNLTKQIEEQSMLESGKLYVRSSRQAMEEFNADRILQSLVKEAGMPVELAQKIASETESRVYKFQTAYLTAPLIREIVNSILVEHGYEEYRHKLTRLGLPVADVTELISKAGDSPDSIDTVLLNTSSKVFAEYAILTKIPRDVSDAHLSGDLNISNLGSWSLMPDSIYVDLNLFYSNPYILGSKLSSIPRLSSIKNFDAAFETLEIFSSAVSREVTNEACLDNLISYLSKLYVPRTKEEQVKMFARMFSSLAASTAQARAKSLTFRLGEPAKDEDVSSQLELRDSLLDAYSRYVENVPVPVIHIEVSPGRYFDRKVVEGISNVISKGGEIALESEGKYLFSGLRLDSLSQKGAASREAVAFLQNLSVNLPRLAYESNKDETYFRAKLSLVLQTAVNALVNRKEYVRDSLKRGLLPAISQIPTVASLEDMPLIINLVGLNSAISNLLSDRDSLTRRELGMKIIETASKVTADKSEKLQQKGLVSMVHLDGVERFSELDVEKYGRSQESRLTPYQEGIKGTFEIIDSAADLAEVADLSRQTSGGCLVRLAFPPESESQTFGNALSGIFGKIPFVRFSRNPEICRKCGMKVFGGGRCPYCKSTSLYPQPVSI